MNVFEAIVCGVVQGATEFLPVSSSGHLAMMHGLFGLAYPAGNLAFDVMLHLATLLSVIVVYRAEIIALVPAFFSMIGKLVRGKVRELSGTERLALTLVIATLPLVLAAFFGDAAEGISENVRAVGILLIINGVMLLCGDRIGKRYKRAENIGAAGAVGTGLFQLVAVFPGISRSGATITGGLAFGLERDEAVKFSFLLSVPAIIGANLKSAVTLYTSGTDQPVTAAQAAGMIAAAITGFFALKLIKYIAERKNFGIFAYYCFAVGLLAVIFG